MADEEDRFGKAAAGRTSENYKNGSNMNISAPFIKRPVMTILVMASILFFGIFAFQKLPVSDLPNIDYPTIQVTTTYPGASPETVGNNITAILEQQFSTIDGLNLIASMSTISSSTIVLQFNLEKKIDSAALDVQSAINAAQALLPPDLPYLPTYTKVNPSASPILYLAVSSSLVPKWDLYEYAHTLIGEQLNMIDGVAQIQVYGYPYAVRVRVDPRKLAARNIGIDEVGTRIQLQNVNNPVGNLYGPDKEYSLKVDGQLLKAEEYNPMILRNDQGAITRISDIGYAMDSQLNDKSLQTYLEKGIEEPSVIIAVLKQGGTNSLAILEAIDKKLPGLIQGIPPSVSIKRLFDRGVFIKESVHDVEFTLVIAFLLVLLVIFLYLGEWIATIIPSLALPIAIIGTFAVMFLLNFSLDILSLLAITLSVGFLVDDAVVVLENIFRHVEMGKTPLQAALDGSREICFTVLSMTCCLIAVFIPLIFMGSVLGKLFSEFSITIIIALFISGVVSISLTPMLSSRFIKPKEQGAKKSLATRISDQVNTKLLAWYTPSLKWAIRHKPVVLLCGLFSLVTSVYLLLVLPKDFFPPDDLGFFMVFSEAADSTSPAKMQQYQTELAKKVIQNPAIASMVSLNGSPQDNQGILFAQMAPAHKRPPIATVLQELQQELQGIPGLRLFYKPLPLIDLQVGTSLTQATYQYTLHAIDEKLLYPAAETLLQKMRQNSLLTQVNSDLHLSQPQYQMKIRRDRASLLNVTAGAIEKALNLAFANSQLSYINTRSNQYYVILETLPEFYKNPDALRQLYVQSTDGHLVPLYTLVSAQETTGPIAVNHINALPSVTISFDLKEGVPLGTAVTEIQKLSKETLPPNVNGNLLGTADVFKETFQNLGILLVVTLFVIYVILGILYENFFHPLTVMSTLPPAALGGLLSLLIFRLPLSLYAFVGIIMLLGIVMKNGIILIDFANDKIDKEKKSVDEAIYEACVTRLRPILMTTVAALMGAVPIALGVGGMTALSRRPLGLVIVFGLIFSQLLTLYFTPVIFIEVERLREKWFQKKSTILQ